MPLMRLVAHPGQAQDRATPPAANEMKNYGRPTVATSFAPLPLLSHYK